MFSRVLSVIWTLGEQWKGIVEEVGIAEVRNIRDSQWIRPSVPSTLLGCLIISTVLVKFTGLSNTESDCEERLSALESI